jgi:hypothetical protein
MLKKVLPQNQQESAYDDRGYHGRILTESTMIGRNSSMICNAKGGTTIEGTMQVVNGQLFFQYAAHYQ